jgi:hypothetical protein
MVRICFLIAGAALICRVHAAFTVSGTVTDYISQSPATQCLVLLQGISPTAQSDSARSGVDGKFLFANVPVGTYRMWLADNRYSADTVLALIVSDTTFSFVALAASHALKAGSFPDTLTKAGSPYLVKGSVSPGKPVVIVPGASVVIFIGSSLTFDSDVNALGTENDSILFTAGYGPGDTGSIGHVFLTKQQGTYRFAYCKFERLSQVEANGPQLFNPQRISFEHCLFDTLYRAFLCNEPVEKLSFTYNRVIGCTRGVGPLVDGQAADTLYMTDNYIQSSIMTLTVRPVAGGTFYVRRNTVLGPTIISCNSLSARDTIASDIFSDDSFLFANNQTLFFAYNDHVASHATPLGIGTNIMLNTKGDSCDAFFNIIKVPLFADSTTGVLLSTSPCIRTGLGGVENMGVYQGQGVSTAVDKGMRSNGGTKGPYKVISSIKGTVVTFAWLNPVAMDKGSISIYSASGKLVKEILLSGNQEFVKCDLSGSGPGVYIASINTGSGRQKIRFALCW